jgi:hypothetical protein
MKIVVVLAALALAGCASAQAVGNQHGGTFEWWGMSTAKAHEMANAHCAKYGRAARIRSMERRGNASVVFDCL